MLANAAVMMYVKLQLCAQRIWLELASSSPDQAKAEIAGLRTGLELAGVLTWEIDTRMSKHPTELFMSREQIKEFIKERRE